MLSTVLSVPLQQAFCWRRKKQKVFSDVKGVLYRGLHLRFVHNDSDRHAANSDAPESEWEVSDAFELQFTFAPVTRTTSRFIFTTVSSFLPRKGVKGAVAKLLNRKWWRHAINNSVLDGDAVFLHRQTIDLINGADASEPGTHAAEYPQMLSSTQ